MKIMQEGNPNSLSFTFWVTIQGISENHLLFPEIELPDKEWIMAILKP